MDKKLKYRYFQYPCELTNWIDLHEVQIVAITRNNNEYTLFYYD